MSEKQIYIPTEYTRSDPSLSLSLSEIKLPAPADHRVLCPWARVNIDYVTYVDILLCLVRSAEQSCRCLGKDLVS